MKQSNWKFPRRLAGIRPSFALVCVMAAVSVLPRPGMAVAAAGCVLFAIFLGWILLGLRGPYFAIGTLGMALSARELAGTGGLVWERRVGRGRVVVTGFSLTTTPGKAGAPDCRTSIRRESAGAITRLTLSSPSALCSSVLPGE